MIIDDMVKVLAGDEAPEDIKHYMTLLSLFGLSTVTNNARVSIEVPTDKAVISANIYNLCVASSGTGKSRSLSYLEDLMLKEADDYLKVKGKEYLDKADPFDMESVNKLVSEGVRVAPMFKSATDAGIGALRSIMDVVGIYGVNIAIDEIGSVLTKEYDMLSDTLLNVFDKGNSKPNLRRSTGVKATVNPIPHSLMMFGSATMLFNCKPEVESSLFSLLEAGMCRRCCFAVVETKTNKYTLDYSGETKTKIDYISNRIKNIAVDLEQKVLVPSEECAKFYSNYEMECRDASTFISEFNTLNIIYVQNKHWLALKLSGIIAASEMSEIIELEHFMKAVEIVDESYNHLNSIVNRKEKYEVLVDYLLDKGTTESEYTLTKELPFYKEIKNKRQFLELAKGYAYDSNITLQIHDKRNITFYSARGKTKTDLDKPLMFSYSTDMSEGYYTNTEGTWKDFYKVLSADGLCYSAHSFKGNKRSNETALTGFQLIILDIDGGVDLETAKILFDEYTYLIATTRNHQIEKKGIIADRFRIILPMEYALDLEADTYTQMMKNMFDDLPIEVDRLADIGRMYFSSKDCEHWYNEGRLFNADKYIPYTQEEETYKKESTRLSKKNINGISQWVIRNQGIGRNQSLIKLALLLVDKGFSHSEAKEEIMRVNEQFDTPLSKSELERTIFKTISKKEEKEIEEEDEDDYYEEDEFYKVDK